MASRLEAYLASLLLLWVRLALVQSFVLPVHPPTFVPIPNRLEAKHDADGTLWVSWRRITSTAFDSSILLHQALADDNEAAEQRQQDRLLSLLSFVQNREEGRLPCGLDANEKEQALVASVIAEVEQDSLINKVELQNGKITFGDLVGDWKLVYTSSRTMIINKSLSGLGRSSSEYSQFVSLVQKLGGSKFLGTVEFLEVFGSRDTGAAEKEEDADEDTSLEVSITGEWYTKDERNLLTGQPTTAIALDLEKIVYGPSSNAAQEWSSLGPVKVLDLIYLSDDIMISRGNVNPESLFVWRRRAATVDG